MLRNKIQQKIYPFLWFFSLEDKFASELEDDENGKKLDKDKIISYTYFVNLM